MKNTALAFENLTVLDYFAIHAPRPTDGEIKQVRERERMANPHNEPYANKQKRHSELEIEVILRYQFAQAMMLERMNPTNLG